jgi:hypothetical protein
MICITFIARSTNRQRRRRSTLDNGFTELKAHDQKDKYAVFARSCHLLYVCFCCFLNGTILVSSNSYCYLQ